MNILIMADEILVDFWEKNFLNHACDLEDLERKNKKSDNSFFSKIKNNIKFSAYSDDVELHNNCNILIIDEFTSRERILLEKSLTHHNVVILNSNVNTGFELMMAKSKNIITFGLQNKACVTASSVENGRVLFCIQRAFLSISGEKIEIQEFAININCMHDSQVPLVLAIVTALIVAGIEIPELDYFF